MLLLLTLALNLGGACVGDLRHWYGGQSIQEHNAYNVPRNSNGTSGIPKHVMCAWRANASNFRVRQSLSCAMEYFQASHPAFLSQGSGSEKNTWLLMVAARGGGSAAIWFRLAASHPWSKLVKVADPLRLATMDAGPAKKIGYRNLVEPVMLISSLISNL